VSITFGDFFGELLEHGSPPTGGDRSLSHLADSEESLNARRGSAPFGVMPSVGGPPEQRFRRSRVPYRRRATDNIPLAAPCFFPIGGREECHHSLGWAMEEAPLSKGRHPDRFAR
jgi:hypothetical protein